MSARTAPPFKDKSVEAAFGAFPVKLRRPLLRLRALIFETAAATDGVGPLEECLKWGQPSYLTPKTKSGSTVRLGAAKDGETCALYVHCQTRLAGMFRAHYPDVFTFEGNRAVHFKPDEALPEKELRHCIQMALTYKKRPRK
ncbi:conserved protein [Tepidicaulis marinus]|uniref:Conserved protein n=1 Tax=Tepidicaulis marinus TaxID=1333998 RepID=A0A081BCY9_9HYPH|nr:DUF1801 domain-containing protein [Tepidicaulis marinus]GAK45907.1 conserved protein [Tepidicaulis marinus]